MIHMAYNLLFMDLALISCALWLYVIFKLYMSLAWPIPDLHILIEF